MLEEMSVSELTLRELSRRVGLAKSNVVRYFETLEAVLLELLNRLAQRFLEELRVALPSRLDASRSASERCRAVSAAITECFDAQPMLCELLSAQAGVLERNVSVEVATQFKFSARENLLALAELLRRALPELDERRSTQAARTIVMLAGAIWTQSHPAPTVRAALDREPDLSFFVTSFPTALNATVGTFLAGLLAAIDVDWAAP